MACTEESISAVIQSTGDLNRLIVKGLLSVLISVISGQPAFSSLSTRLSFPGSVRTFSTVLAVMVSVTLGFALSLLCTDRCLSALPGPLAERYVTFNDPLSPGAYSFLLNFAMAHLQVDGIRPIFS